MPFTLTMPKLSPTMEEGTIAKWHKKVGELVEVGDVLFEVATDKATVEHSAIDAGYLREILVKEGESALLNQPVAVFTENQEESIEGYKPEAISVHKVEKKKEEKQEVKKETKAIAKEMEAVSLSQPSFTPEPPLEGYTFTGAKESIEKRTPSSPLARKLAKDKGVDISSVKGSGPHGRVMSRDLDLAQPDLPVSFGRNQLPTTAPGSFEEVPMTQMRKAIGKRLQESKSFIPHFYVTQEIMADALYSIRTELVNLGHRISFNDFVIKACALALREHPKINSGFNSVKSEIILFKTVDISIAVTLDAGLITPIIRHADYKNLGEIAVEVKALAQKARQGKLSREEYAGGSFTISNLGMYKVSGFSGIINPPQAALMAVGGIEDKAVVKNGQVVPGKTMQLTLSCDHRVIDGTGAAEFIKTVQKLLENPAGLLI